ncbi:hypothetical protein [Streptomyces wuyuanensis]|uniref:hypothetical protein n=1 Tax=Streptomyces wuyuanensis TaxID=1196353 RepID=UPI003422F124
MAGVAFQCESIQEAEVICNAVNRYGRVVLRAEGVDLRNYAPANSEGAGFGWDAVQRAARDMGKGTITHMSVRMAEAIRLALESRAENGANYDRADTAAQLATRMSACIRHAQQKGK